MTPRIERGVSYTVIVVIYSIHVTLVLDIWCIHIYTHIHYFVIN